MNKELIQKLKTQALLYAQEKCEGKPYDRNGVLRSDILSDKFAELIIQECTNVLSTEMNRLDELDRVAAAQTMDTAQVLIKQHFGFEE